MLNVEHYFSIIKINRIKSIKKLKWSRIGDIFEDIYKIRENVYMHKLLVLNFVIFSFTYLKMLTLLYIIHYN